LGIIKTNGCLARYHELLMWRWTIYR